MEPLCKTAMPRKEAREGWLFKTGKHVATCIATMRCQAYEKRR